MNSELQKIINPQDAWIVKKGIDPFWVNKNKSTHNKSLPTGFSSMDKILYLNGWPLGASIEILGRPSTDGIMDLWLPAMKLLNQKNRWQIFIAPPYIPYSPTLLNKGIDIKKILLIHPKDNNELLWVTEQALRSKTCSIVFSWLGSTKYHYDVLRKLQLAASESGILLVLFRDSEIKYHQTPSAMRLLFNDHRRITILKQRGGKQNITIQLPYDKAASIQIKAKESYA